MFNVWLSRETLCKIAYVYENDATWKDCDFKVCLFLWEGLAEYLAIIIMHLLNYFAGEAQEDPKVEGQRRL